LHWLDGQDKLIKLGMVKGNKGPFSILDNISGVLKPVRRKLHAPTVPVPARCWERY